MTNRPTGEQSKQNMVEKVASRVMGVKTAEGQQDPNIVVGQEYGRTPYSDQPHEHYEKTRDTRTAI